MKIIFILFLIIVNICYCKENVQKTLDNGEGDFANGLLNHLSSLLIQMGPSNNPSLKSDQKVEKKQLRKENNNYQNNNYKDEVIDQDPETQTKTNDQQLQDQDQIPEDNQQIIELSDNINENHEIISQQVNKDIADSTQVKQTTNDAQINDAQHVSNDIIYNDRINSDDSNHQQIISQQIEINDTIINQNVEQVNNRTNDSSYLTNNSLLDNFNQTLLNTEYATEISINQNNKTEMNSSRNNLRFMNTKDITKDIEVDDDENSLDNQNKLKKKPKAYPEDCANLANIAHSNQKSLMINDTYSHFQDELFRHLHNVLGLMSTDHENKKIIHQKSQVVQQVSSNNQLTVIGADQENQFFEKLKSLGIHPRVEIKLAYGQEKMSVQQLNDLLGMLNTKEHLEVLNANKYIFNQIYKANPLEKEFVDQVKLAGRYFFDLDFLLTMMKKTPEISKKDIQFKIYMQLQTYIVKFTQDSQVELFDPQFKVAIKQYIEQFNIILDDKDLEGNLQALMKLLDNTQKISRARLVEILNYLDKSDEYFYKNQYEQILYQMVNFDRGDYLFLEELNSRKIQDLDQKDADGYSSTCIPGKIMSQYVISSFPLLEYYNKVSKTYFYTTDIEEVGAVNNFQTGLGGWQFRRILGYVFTIEMPNTIPLHKFYNKDKNRFFYTLKMTDVNLSLSGQVGFINNLSSTKEISKLQAKAFDTSDHIVYMGIIAYIYQYDGCWINSKGGAQPNSAEMDPLNKALIDDQHHPEIADHLLIADANGKQVETKSSEILKE